MAKSLLKILIADDHNVVRKGIMKSLASRFSEITFGEASNGADVLRKVHEEKWDLVILDISMPGRSGLEVLAEIKELQPKLPVIIFSMYPEDQFAVRCLKAGASAYLSKEVSSEELESAITKILNGDRFISPTVTSLLIDELQNKNKKSAHESLSDREYQVLILISQGKSVSDIGRELNLSVKTVSVYRSNILTKMNLKNNSEMMYYAFKNNLVY